MIVPAGLDAVARYQAADVSFCGWAGLGAFSDRGSAWQQASSGTGGARGSPALSASLARFGDLPRRHTAELFLGKVAPPGRLEVVERAMGLMAGLGLQMFGVNDAVTVRMSLFRTCPQGVWC